MFSSYYMDRHGHVYPNQINQDDVRVVVISPEDREQVERLVELFESQRGESMFSKDDDHMQAALREFANPTPPKPAEPTEPSARVIDRNGLAWASYDGSWLPLGSGKFARMTWDFLCEQRGPLEVQS